MTQELQEHVVTPKTPKTSHEGLAEEHPDTAVHDDERGALQLSRAQRSWLLVVGFSALLLGLATIAMDVIPGLDPTNSGELRGAVLLIVGAVGLILGLVGRLPLAFQLAGMSLDFSSRKKQAEDVLAQVQDLAIKSDPTGATEERMRELLRQLSTNAPDFARSWETAKKSGDVEPISEASDWRDDLRRKNIEIKTKVPVKTKGPGNPPVVAELFAIDDRRVIVEEPNYWNTSNQDLLTRRIRRMLDAETPVSLIAITATDHFFETAEEITKKLDSPGTGTRVVAFRRGSEPGALSVKRIKELLAIR